MVHKGYDIIKAEITLNRLSASKTPTVDAMNDAKENWWPSFWEEEAQQLVRTRFEDAISNSPEDSEIDPNDELDSDWGISHQD